MAVPNGTSERISHHGPQDEHLKIGRVENRPEDGLELQIISFWGMELIEAAEIPILLAPFALVSSECFRVHPRWCGVTEPLLSSRILSTVLALGRCPDTPPYESFIQLVQEMICRNKVILLAMIAGLTDYIGSVFCSYNISIPVIIRNVNVAGMDPLSFRKRF